MSWWRRQRFALAGLLVAAAAAAGVHYWFDVQPWAIDRGAVRITADAGGPVDGGGHRLSVSSVRWDEFEAPAGSDSTTVSVRLNASSEDESDFCGTFLLSETGNGRTWLDARGAVDIDSDTDERSCQQDSASYSILAVFLVPADASGPFWLDVPIEGSQTLRLAVDG